MVTVWIGCSKELCVDPIRNDPAAGIAALDTGARFNLGLDKWTGATKQTARPARRSMHTAVWTGSEMIVWGGRGSAGLLLVGGDRYDPATDRWQGLTLAGAPSGRVYHTAVWSGTEMVVWGGEDAAGATSTGSRYNPTTGAWTATPDPPGGVPEPRLRHTAVWAETQMIVWGGDDGAGTYFQTGGRLTTAGVWAATSLTNAPTSRSRHTAVWSTSPAKMIVWGGADASTTFGNGSEYVPTSNAWTSITGLGPSRAGHTAVWTGSDMIVWGGTDPAGAPVSTGGRYSPTSLSWRTMSATGAPRARSGHAAGWNGKDMVVWGGKDAAGSPLASGARYTTQTDTWTALSETQRWRQSSGGGAEAEGKGDKEL